jgi:hypothetical protein
MKPARRRPVLSFANVVSVLALFVALGGSAYAATQIPRNSVGTKQLKNGSITAAKIRNGAVTAAKLGALPIAPAEAQRAAEAEALNGKTAAQLLAESKLHCPAGTELAVGACLDATPGAAVALEQAFKACGRAGKRLPSTGELIAFEMAHFTEFPPTEWVEPEYVDSGSAFYATGILVSARGGPSPNASIDFEKVAGPRPYRCATGESN